MRCSMRVPPVHAKVGPRVFPYLVSCGLAVTGAVIAWQAWRAELHRSRTQQTDWGAVAIIAAGLILHMNLLKPWASCRRRSILFMSVTFAFGSRRYLRDGIVAHGSWRSSPISASPRLLGLQLPAGHSEGALLMEAFSCPDGRLCHGAHAHQPDVVAGRRDARHADRHPARHRPGADHRAAAAGHPQSRSRPAPSSCSPASTTAPCMAVPPPRSCSTRRANPARSSPRSKATRWRGAGAALRRWRRPPSAPSWPARSARCC